MAISEVSSSWAFYVTVLYLGIIPLNSFMSKIKLNHWEHVYYFYRQQSWEELTAEGQKSKLSWPEKNWGRRFKAVKISSRYSACRGIVPTCSTWVSSWLVDCLWPQSHPSRRTWTSCEVQRKPETSNHRSCSVKSSKKDIFTVQKVTQETGWTRGLPTSTLSVAA